MVIFSAVLLAVVPATALAIGPVPPVYAPPGDYVVRGTLSGYLPATPLVNGSVTIRVQSANTLASFAVGKTLTFRTTIRTRIAFDRFGQIRNGDSGQIRLSSQTHLSTLTALQAVPAAMVLVDRMPEQSPLD